MATEIRVPTLGESVTEATVGQWFKKVGDTVKVDEPLVELETDKVTLEVPAPGAGVISAIDVKDGATVGVGALLGSIEANGAAAAPKPAAEKAAPVSRGGRGRGRARPAQPAKAGAAPSPAARKILSEGGVEPAGVAGSGKDGRITKADALAVIEAKASQPPSAPAPVAARARPRPTTRRARRGSR